MGRGRVPAVEPSYAPACAAGVIGRVKGAFPQDRQLVTLYQIGKFITSQGATVGAARGVQWWKPGAPIYCMLIKPVALQSTAMQVLLTQT